MKYNPILYKQKYVPPASIIFYNSIAEKWTTKSYDQSIH